MRRWWAITKQKPRPPRTKAKTPITEPKPRAPADIMKVPLVQRQPARPLVHRQEKTRNKRCALEIHACAHFQDGSICRAGIGMHGVRPQVSHRLLHSTCKRQSKFVRLVARLRQSFLVSFRPISAMFFQITRNQRKKIKKEMAARPQRLPGLDVAEIDEDGYVLRKRPSVCEETCCPYRTEHDTFRHNIIHIHISNDLPTVGSVMLLVRILPNIDL